MQQQRGAIQMLNKKGKGGGLFWIFFILLIFAGYVFLSPCGSSESVWKIGASIKQSVGMCNDLDYLLGQACVNSGGNVTTASCCMSTSDFPNTCVIGACGCSLNESQQVKTCDCGAGKCFNGEACV